MHTTTRTDTVAATYDMGKKLVLKALKSLFIVGDPQTDLESDVYINRRTMLIVSSNSSKRLHSDLVEVCTSVTTFPIVCFVKTYTDCNSMIECHLKMRKKKTDTSQSIKLCILSDYNTTVYLLKFCS